jgi:uncharacterized protein YbjQ (UPF0145 family)
MHAITKLKRDIAFSRRRTLVGPLRNAEKLALPTMAPAAKRKKANGLTVESKSQSKDQRDLFEESQ